MLLATLRPAPERRELVPDDLSPPTYASAYEHVRFERRGGGVTLITIDRAEHLNAANARLHRELGQVWLDIDRDADTRVAVITGAGSAFSAGGDFELLEARDFEAIATLTREVRDIVVNMVECEKVIVSAINGVAVGAGLAVALMADISVAGENVRLTDGHLRLGVAAGDHAAIIWPLLCGMAKAKLYLLTSDFLDGREAERIGLVSRCVADDRVVDEALEIAGRLAAGPRHALAWTKRSLNHWLRQAMPTFESSLAYEMLNFFGADLEEGAQAIREKRSPRFPSAERG
jgi:enoyl-CoA hydratase